MSPLCIETHEYDVLERLTTLQSALGTCRAKMKAKTHFFKNLDLTSILVPEEDGAFTGMESGSRSLGLMVDCASPSPASKLRQPRRGVM